MEPWWKDGLRFECTVCGRCCHARGEVAQVYANRRERQALADFLGIEAEVFDARYTQQDEDGHLTLRFEDGHCVFLKDDQCSVHEAKPVQCRTWPFWEELLESEQTYREEVLDFCPGSGTGPVVPATEVSRQVAWTESEFERGEV